MKSIFSFLILVLLFIACKKEERPIPKKEMGDLVENQVEMGTNYRYQFYYKLETNEIIASNLKTAWDIAFTSGENDYELYLNASKAMAAMSFEGNEFESFQDTSGFMQNRIFDASSGNLDSTAIGDWRIEKPVYLIDLGFSYTGIHLGYRKMQLLDVSHTDYEVRFAKLDNSEDTTVIISKNPEYNAAFWSFETNEIVMIEPPKTDWDLGFTQYVHIFYEPQAIPYIVTGVLLNRYETVGALETNLSFENINLNYAQTLTKSQAIDCIGYDWKDFVDGTYVLNYNNSYIIQDQNGYYYKLRFTDFFSPSGDRGAPKWEVQRL